MKNCPEEEKTDLLYVESEGFSFPNRPDAIKFHKKGKAAFNWMGSYMGRYTVSEDGKTATVIKSSEEAFIGIDKETGEALFFSYKDNSFPRPKTPVVETWKVTGRDFSEYK